MEVQFFSSIVELRKWFRVNGESLKELYIGFYRKDSGMQAVTYAEALDEALCWGWIDGVRKKVDDTSYTNRFTPRKSNSIWSLVNIEHVNRLTAAGRMKSAGLAAFEARKADKTGVYSFEQASVVFDANSLKLFKTNKKAWAFWEKQPPGYRRVATHWTMSVKLQETRDRRLQKLIDECELGRRLGELTGKKNTDS